jgi:hypothetical protein
MKFRKTLALFACGTTMASPALACTADPIGDFESSYSGPPVAGVDVTCAGVRLTGTNLIFEVTTAAPVSSAESSYTVWGINRGQGVPRLQFIGAPPPIRPDVLFDAILVARRDGVAEVGLFAGMGPPAFTYHPGTVSIDGSIMRVILPEALFPSAGFALWQYGFTSWTHFEADGAGFDISNVWKADFSESFRATIPEPAAWAMLIAGFGLVGMAARRRRLARLQL